MTDLEISKQLALAIGWYAEDIQTYKYQDRIEVWWHDGWDSDWRGFDHRDWNVIGPIAEWYDAFPISDGHQWWVPSCARTGSKLGPAADTPRKAIALAVIQGAGK